MEKQLEQLDHPMAGLPSRCLGSSRIEFSVHTANNSVSFFGFNFLAIRAGLARDREHHNYAQSVGAATTKKSDIETSTDTEPAAKPQLR